MITRAVDELHNINDKTKRDILSKRYCFAMNMYQSTFLYVYSKLGPKEESVTAV